MINLTKSQPLYTLTIGEWIELQKSILVELVQVHPARTNEAKELLSIDETSDYLGLSKATLYSMNCRRQIPFTKVLGKVYYRKSALDQWLATGDRKTQAQLNKEIWEGR